ncbi:hypothetical protein BZA70DRAFT_279770 [Myxozyma melibiosi]|uniref:Nucleolar protein 12 n=1 Tax=Myxozyma melibiosi TaxID=54550 RepID=A0ABR1F4F3_9ASCO
MSLFGVDIAKVDQAVASLFATPAPVAKPSRSKRQRLEAESLAAAAEDEDDLELSEEVEEQEEETNQVSKDSKKRKKRAAQLDEDDDEEDAAAEDRYLQKLLDEESKSKKKKSKKEKKSAKQEEVAAEVEEAVEDKSDGSDSDDSEDEQDSDSKDVKLFDATGAAMVHESLLDDKDQLDKAKRTIFIGNLANNVISSKTEYGKLKKHFAQYGKIESIRFRSVAFSEMLPRKVAFIKHKLHEKRHAVNAYIVFETEDAARKSLAANSTVLLDRHIRVDSVAHPAKQDAKRSVFIGNLDFEAEEEQLWEHFSKVGDVEYVRIVRDSKTNVGKGFAYVQFKDSMYVAKALLLNDTKMGTRKLRVTRARNIPAKTTARPLAKPTARVLDPDTKASLNRTKKVVGKAERAKISSYLEGERSSVGGPVSLKSGVRKKSEKKPRIRARSTAFKKNLKEGKPTPGKAAEGQKKKTGAEKK